MNDYTICPYDDSYLSEIQAIYRNFINGYVGPVIRSQAYWEGQIQWCNEEPDDFLLALKGGKVMAYIRKRLTDDGVIQIKECCYLPEEENAVHALLLRICEKNPEMKGFKASLPSKHALYQLLQKGDHFVESEETYSMWKILDFSRFVEKLRGLLTQRVIEAKSLGFDSSTLLLQCGSDAILISAQDEWVDITNPTEPILYDDLIKRTPKEFLTDLLFGTEIDHEFYSLLFPKKGYLFCGTDAF